MARTQKSKSARSRKQTKKITKAHSAITSRGAKALVKEQGERKDFQATVDAVLEEFKVIGQSRYGGYPIYNRKPDNYCGKGETGGPWTQFWDMSSGGSQKEPYHFIYIEAPAEEAEIIFYNRFGHSPSRVTCTCCGADYSVSQSATLAEATAYHRGCKSITYQVDGINEFTKEPKTEGISVEEPSEREWDAQKFMSLADYLEKNKTPGSRDSVLVIRKEDIKPGERVGSVPKQGYVWQD